METLALFGIGYTVVMVVMTIYGHLSSSGCGVDYDDYHDGENGYEPLDFKSGWTFDEHHEVSEEDFYQKHELY